METSRGDLDRVLIVKAERDSVANFRTPERGIVPAVVQTPRAFYEGRLATARTTYDRAARAAHAQLLLDLDALVKEQTRSGMIDAAIATREQRKKVEKEFPGAPQMPTPSKSKESVAVAPMPKPPLDPRPVIPATPAPKAPATKSPPEAIASLPSDPVDLPRPPVLNPAEFTFAKAVANPPRITVKEIDPILLDLKSAIDKSDVPAFHSIPEQFLKHKATMFAIPKNKHNGIAEITVQADGYLFLACNYSNQGNSGGGWQKERWTAKQFVQNGWRHLTNDETGGVLQKAKMDKRPDRQFEIFVKFVKKGEAFRLRCNKYEPPYPIVFGLVK